jgi:hypothetical protein
MENDVKDQQNQCDQSLSKSSKSIIDTINNNINCLIERLQSESEKVKIVACDESSLPSPKAMLETIMPCEKICNSFRHIADDLSAGTCGDHIAVHKTQIKSEPSGFMEPKLAGSGVTGSAGEECEGGDQYPLNLKSLKYASERQKVSEKFLLKFLLFISKWRNF